MCGIKFIDWWSKKGRKSPAWGGYLFRRISSFRREVIAYEVWNAALDGVFTDWQPICTAPKGEYVLVAYRMPFASAPNVEAAVYAKGRWRDAGFKVLINEPKYWMSLPKAPEGV